MPDYNGEIKGADGLVVVEYLGGNFGTEIYNGAGRSPARYSFSAKKSRLYVPVEDAKHLVKAYWRDDEPTFRIVPSEVIADTDTPDAGEAGEAGDGDGKFAFVGEAESEEPDGVEFPDVTGHSVSWLEKELARNDYSVEVLRLMLASEEIGSNRKTAVKLLKDAIADASTEEE